MDLLHEFNRNWQARKFTSAGKKVLLAVSGGIDSIVMADLFLKAEILFGVAHCNFQLRGKEADQDEDLVRQWAIKNNVPVFTTAFDTGSKAKEWKKGIQETARILRYEWLDSVCLENDFGYIATAHHANDNAETLLINLFKGTGISGLHGIPEINGRIIRPLLFASRDAILEYAQKNSIAWREDASNTSDKYLRNAVRNEILPVAENYFPGIVSHLNHSIKRFREVEEIYNAAIEKERRKLIEQRGRDYYIPILKLRNRKPLNTVCYELFKPFGFSSAQVSQIISLLDADTGHFVNSSGHRAIRNRDFIIVTALNTTETDLITIEGIPCVIDAGHRHFHFTLAERFAPIPEGANTAMIDLSKLEFPLVLRKWKLGDYFYPLGMGMKKKKLSRFFIDQKVPLHEKDQVWVLETGKRVVWISGLRLDERFKITPQTHKILKVVMKMP